jgi:hypothetical protein
VTTSAETSKRKGRGRPPKAPERGKRQNYTFRLHDSTRERLSEIAQENGRSLSEEIEYRIERSFREVDVQNILNFYFGGNETIALLREMAPYITYQMAKSRKSWRNDKATRDAIQEHLSGLFDALDDEVGYAERTAAWEAMVEHDQNAWKNPSPPPGRLASSPQNANEQAKPDQAPTAGDQTVIGSEYPRPAAKGMSEGSNVLQLTNPKYSRDRRAELKAG